MATLTPGVLVKLLQSMNSDTKVGGEHRSAVLQVIGIVPAPAGPGGDDLWPARGFYLQLSDSANSTYVSLSEPEAESVLSSRPQLGQLVHVDRFRLAPPCPVPRASGLRPIPFPGRSPPPFAGRPEPLVARPSPCGDGAFVILPASPSDAIPPMKNIAPFPDDKPAGGTRTVFAAKENVVVGPAKSPNAEAPSAAKSRFSSPAGARSRSAARKSNGEQRDPSPAVKGSSRPPSPAARGSSRPSSPVPSKCEVPSLVAARDENRKTAREPAIVVPSRYRQPSPVASRRAAASPVGRRSGGSPGRRLSGGVKVSPASGESGGKKKVAAVVAGISRISEALVASTKSVRKSWEDPSPRCVAPSEQEKKGVSKKKVDHHAILKTQVAMSRRLSDACGGQSSNEETSSNEKNRKSNISERSSVSEKPNYAATKITVHDRKWTDGSIPLDSVSDNLAKLGKETLQRRNIASTAAAEALEEACAAESVVRSLSMFADLCSSSKSANPLPTIDRFLFLYEDVIKCYAIAESLATSKGGGGLNDAMSIERRKSTSLWVEAALATDLGVVSLVGNSEKSDIPSVDPPRTNVSKRSSLGTPSKNNSKVTACPTTNAWTRGHGVGETLELAKTLRHEMETWFLKFVEEAVDMGFRLFGEPSNGGRNTSSLDNGKIAAVLSHLKNVNEWLDRVVKRPEEGMLAEMIEQLKRKIYGFVISHVGSAFDGAVSLSKD